MRKVLIALILLVFCFGCRLSCVASAGQSVFAVPPYLQVGETGKSGDLLICWAVAGKAVCKLEYKDAGATEFKAAEVSQQPLYTRAGVRFFQAKLNAVSAGKQLSYRILLDDQQVFESSAKVPPAEGQVKLALLGDIACGGMILRRLAPQITAFEPDVVMLTGDLTPPMGTANAYLGRFFPELNSLMRSTPFLACAGDRDISTDKYDPDKKDNRNLDAVPGGMAYFCFWKQPGNGPGKAGAKNTPVVSGSPEKVAEFEKAAGAAYPKAANYSVDLGDSHWLVLDGGSYVNWRDEEWRTWVRNDLKASKKTWNFVVVHQAPFSSDPNHGEEQRVRSLSDLFEDGHVDIVFSGHSNSYQRSCPLRFAPQPQDPGDTDPETAQGYVYGKFKMDKNFDGVEKRLPDGVVYVISGGGGDDLAEKRVQDDKTRWQPYTKKFYSEKGSVTLLELNGKELKMRQVNEDGQEVDAVRISK